ncbi:vitamin K epoxide reductase family protein [Cupriavidus necator]
MDQPHAYHCTCGLFISRYLAAYQLGHIDAAWDPLFGDGTERIVTSSVSEAWPIADAGLGATVYVLEIITGVVGDKRRWRTMPWLVLLFGILIVPLGVVSIGFIIIQPIWIGTWCALCLIGALAMLLQIPYSFDEILSTSQFLKDRRQQGKKWWYVLVRGDSMDGGSADTSDNFAASAGTVVRAMLFSGVSLPWTLLASCAIGVTLMCTRLLFEASGLAVSNDQVLGALVVTFSIMAWGDVARPLRLVNIGLGVWLMTTPWVIQGYTDLGAAASGLLGVALILLSIPLGRIEGHYGEWDRIARLRLRMPMRKRVLELRGWNPSDCCAIPPCKRQYFVECKPMSHYHMQVDRWHRPARRLERLVHRSTPKRACPAIVDFSWSESHVIPDSLAKRGQRPAIIS